jgi:sialate O-acetylesterase
MTTRDGTLGMTAVFLVIATTVSAADPATRLNLPAIFSDGMVLQRDKPVAVWGWDKPGAAVTVAFAGQTKSAQADASGRWTTLLDPLAASAEPRELIVSSSGGGTKTVGDVLVGEVWLCGGQSNMAMTVDGKTGWLHIGGVLDAKKVVAESANPRIRQFYVDWKVNTTPLDDCTGKWTAAGPETTPHFSATGYFFARSLEKKLGVPVAIVSASWGGSTAENWTSRETLVAGTDPEFVAQMQKIVHDYDYHDDIHAQYLADLAAWEMSQGRADPGGADEDARYAAAESDLAGWKRVTLPAPLEKLGFPHGGVVWLRREIDVPEHYGKNWRLDFPATGGAATVFMDGVAMEAGGRPRLPKEVARAGRHVVAVKLHAQDGKAGIARGSFAVVPFDPKRSQIPLMGDWLCIAEKEFAPLVKGSPAWPKAPVKAALHWQPVPGQFNGMLNPLIPYGVRGVAWYQGESNVGKPAYAKHLKLLVTDWRSRFGQGDLPFLVCQLPGNGPPSTAVADSKWAACREAQMAVLELPNTAVANLIDTCEDGDLHPRNKKDAGERLALVALGKVYGDTSVAWSGPTFDSLTIEGSKAVVTFHNADGLAARPLPATYRPKLWDEPFVTKQLEQPSPTSALQGFMLCGADGVWHWADARIEGSRVVVTCAAVKAPFAVRYAWADHPICNLVNAAGLPGFPFRTDDFPLAPPGPTPK